MAEISTKTVPAQTVMSLSFTGAYTQTGDRVDELIAWLLREGHPYGAPPLCVYYDDPQKIPEQDLRAEACLPVQERCEASGDVERKSLPQVEVAFALHNGPYSEIGGLYAEIFAWIAENGYQCDEEAGCREVFLTSPGEVESVDELVTEVQVTIKKAQAVPATQ